MIRASFTLLCLGFLPLLSPAADDRWTFSFYFENDLFADTDKNYTNGAKFSWISPDLSQYREAGKLPQWAYNAIRHLPFINREGIQRNVVFSFGQSLYTPEDISRTDLIVNDRPYAAWLYTAIAFHNKTDKWLDTMELNLGLVGPGALGEETQNFIHDLRDIQTAEGWEHQIRNELAINLIWERKWRRDLIGNGTGFGVDALSHIGASMGNVFTYANAGGGLRAGWNLPKDFGASLIRLAGDTNAPAATDDIRFRKRSFSFHIFAIADGRATIRDLTLDGNSWRDSHRVDKEFWVGDVAFGTSFIFGAWKISYAQTFRSKTFKGDKYHTFGSINISLTY